MPFPISLIPLLGLVPVATPVGAVPAAASLGPAGGLVGSPAPGLVDSLAFSPLDSSDLFSSAAAGVAGGGFAEVVRLPLLFL